MRRRVDLAQALHQAPLEKEPRTRTDRRRGGATVKHNSRRARIPGRSLRGSRARPSRPNPSENPVSNELLGLAASYPEGVVTRPASALARAKRAAGRRFPRRDS